MNNDSFSRSKKSQQEKNTHSPHPHPSQKAPLEDEGKKIKKRGGLSRIRTFRADTEHFVKEKGVTLSSLLTERKKKTSSPYSRPKKGYGIFVLGILLLAAAGGAVWFLFFGMGAAIPVPMRMPEKPPSFYPLFDDRVIMVRNSPSDFLPSWQGFFGESISEKQMLGVFAFDREREAYLSAKEWFALLDIAIPNSLSVTFREPWTLGMVGTTHGVEPIWIIPVASFASAFEGMLAWEKDLPFALRNVLPPGHPKREFEQFRDTIIVNQDVRFLENETEELLFAYTFFNRKILIMAPSLEALEIILNRFLIDPPRL